MSAFRLFHGDAEGIPGLAVDRFGDVAVIHVDSARLLDKWLPSIRASVTQMNTGYAKVHLRHARRAPVAPDAPSWGPPVESVEVDELGVHYLIRPARGLTVGLFLDMRDVRQWLRSATAGRSVLNLFAYTCSLGVAAALGGATRVINLDLARPYLEWGKANYALNGLKVDDRDFIYGDAFDWLGRLARREQRFDLVIVDPPSFSSTPFSVTRDYPRLTQAGARVASRGGVLLAATNHARTTEARFDQWVADGLSRAGRSGRVIERWHEPSADFPVAPGGRPYLKVRALELD